MKKLTKKLQLDQQTLRVLDATTLANVAGGADAPGARPENTDCTLAKSGCVSGKWCDAV